MSKSVLIGLLTVAILGVGVGTYFVVNKDDTPTTGTSQASAKETPATKDKTALVDPEGAYNLFSDPSVTKHPEAGFTFGNNQEMSFEYDGSKTGNDEYATLTYELYYIQDNGSVAPMTSGNLSGRGKGTFSTSDKVFRSEVDGRKGFVGLVGTYNTGLDSNGAIKGTNVKLGMYSVVYEVSE